MSAYYKQNFVDAAPIFAEVKETLHSYFASGAIDDIMFPKWTEHCLRRFRKSGLKIEQTVLHVNSYKASLPDNFNSVREAWMCTSTCSDVIPDASARYYQKDCRIYQPDRDKCDPCFESDTCTTDYMVMHKVTGARVFSFTRSFLLKPGNIHAANHCGDHCPNLFASCEATFDIQDCKFITNFCDGTVYLIYYANPDEDGTQMVPDNFWVQDFIRKFLIFKCFEKLSHVITDETFNQVDRKKQEAKQDQAEAFIAAETELKKQTTTEKMRAIKESYNRNSKFNLPNDPSITGTGFSSF